MTRDPRRRNVRTQNTFFRGRKLSLYLQIKCEPSRGRGNFHSSLCFRTNKAVSIRGGRASRYPHISRIISGREWSPIAMITDRLTRSKDTIFKRSLTGGRLDEEIRQRNSTRRVGYFRLVGAGVFLATLVRWWSPPSQINRKYANANTTLTQRSPERTQPFVTRSAVPRDAAIYYRGPQGSFLDREE